MFYLQQQLINSWEKCLSESWTHIECKGNKMLDIIKAIKLARFNKQLHMKRGESYLPVPQR